MEARITKEPLTVGWREWVALPQFGLPTVRTKIDSGARTSSLRVEALEEFERDGGPWLRFGRSGSAGLEELKVGSENVVDR